MSHQMNTQNLSSRSEQRQFIQELKLKQRKKNLPNIHNLYKSSPGTRFQKFSSKQKLIFKLIPTLFFSM